MYHAISTLCTILFLLDTIDLVPSLHSTQIDHLMCSAQCTVHIVHILPCAQFYHSYKSCEQKHPNQCVRCSTKCAHTCKSQIKVNHILLFYIFSDHISLFRLYRGEGDPSLHTHWEVPNLPFSTIQHSISLHSISFSPLSRFHLLGHFHHHCANRNLGEC